MKTLLQICIIRHLLNKNKNLQLAQQYFFERLYLHLVLLLRLTLLDSGAESSLISFDLARLLIKNGANWEYVWPKIGCYPFYELFTFHYRNICDLTLQSVENISVKMTTSIRVDECTPFFQDKLPFILIVNKMVSLGLPMIQSNERRLNDTMFSENDPK